MEIIKIVGIGFIAIFMIIILKQYKPEYAIYVSIIAGIIIVMLVMDKLTNIIHLLTSLQNKGSINNQFILMLLKITGIAFLTEYSSSICKDAGETAVATKIDIGGKIIIIAISIPIIQALLELLLRIMP